MTDTDLCRNCGAHVSDRFRRVFGDRDNVMHRCPECDTFTRLKRGSGAGLEVNRTDPATDADDRAGGPAADQRAAAEGHEP